MKRILIPISFSKSSENSLRHAATVFSKARLTLLHVYPMQKYSRKFDFGKKDYATAIRVKLNEFYNKHVENKLEKPYFLANAGTTSQIVAKISGNYDLLVMSRKAHLSKDQEYFSEKKLFLTTKARCPVLLMPITNTTFTFEKCENIWHIKQRETESKLVKKGLKVLGINSSKFEEKSLQQSTFISSFWQYIIAYQNSHNKKLLKKIDESHDNEPIDMIVLVDNEPNLFRNFFKSDVIHLFCKYDIPILVFPVK